MTQEFVRGARVRQRATGTDLFTALVGLVGRQRRRYAGYIVHLGIVLMFLGFAGEGFKREEQVLLAPGENVTVGRFTVTPRGALRDRRRPEADGDGAPRGARADGAADRRAAPGEVVLPQARETSRRPRWRSAAARPRTSTSCSPASTSSGSRRRCTSSSTRSSTGSGSASACWRFGTILALLPERVFAFAMARVPENAVTSALIILALLAGASHAHAQHQEGVSEAFLVPRRRRSSAICRRRSSACAARCGRKRLARVHVRPGGQDARRAGRAGRAGQGPRAGLPVLHRRSGAARSRWPRRSTRASTASRGRSRTPSACSASASRPRSPSAGRARRSRPWPPRRPPSPVDPALEQRLADELRDLD